MTSPPANQRIPCVKISSADAGGNPGICAQWARAQAAPWETEAASRRWFSVPRPAGPPESIRYFQFSLLPNFASILGNSTRATTDGASRQLPRPVAYRYGTAGLSPYWIG